MKSRKIINSLWRIAALFLFLYVIFGHQYRLTYNKGESMEPTHSNGEWIIIEKRNYLPKNWTPDKYDIVVIEENGYSENLCKRVIGVAGDKVEIKKGYIFLNGKKLKDPFGKGRISFYLTDENDDYLYYWGTNNRVIKYADQGETVIPEGFVWVIGDNREISWFGLLPTKNIKGLVIL